MQHSRMSICNIFALMMHHACHLDQVGCQPDAVLQIMYLPGWFASAVNQHQRRHRIGGFERRAPTLGNGWTLQQIKVSVSIARHLLHFCRRCWRRESQNREDGGAIEIWNLMPGTAVAPRLLFRFIRLRVLLGYWTFLWQFSVRRHQEHLSVTVTGD